MSKENITPLCDFLRNRFNKNFLFYDAELEDVFKHLDAIFDSVKRVKKRFNRRETIRVSPSMCQYVQLLDEENNAPYMLYRFIDKNVTICISKFDNFFYVFIDGFCLKRIDNIQFRKESNLYGGFAHLNDCIPLFHRIIGEYLSEVENGLFPTLV